MRKENIVLYLSQYKSIRTLSLEDKGRLFDSLFYYLENEEEPQNLPPLVYMAFSFIRTQIDIDTDKYISKCERNRNNITKRWNEKNTNVYDRIPTNTNDTDNDKEEDKEDEEDKESTKVDIKKKSTRFIPPTILELQAYISEKKYNVNANKFFDFYTSKGWMVGKNKMKDWKAAIRTWSNSEKKGNTPEIGITLRDNNINKYDKDNLW